MFTILASLLTYSAAQQLQIPPPNPVAYPSPDQTVMISGNFLSDPLVANAVAYVKSKFQPTFPPHRTCQLIWETQALPVTGGLNGNSRPKGLCTRTTDTADFKADIVVCPNANDWGIAYDDGPSNDPAGVAGTPQLLSALGNASITSTMFFIGANVQKNPQYAKDAFSRGHQIAAHTWTHHPLTSLTTEQIVAEFKYTEAMIYQTLGVVPLYFRPPYGDIDDRVRAIVSALGYRTVFWTTSPSRDDQDTVIPQIASTVLSFVKTWFVPQAGFISLSHDNSVFTTGTNLQVLAAIKAMGSSFPLKPQPVGMCLGQSPEKWYVYANGSKVASSSAFKMSGAWVLLVGIILTS